MAPCTHLPIFFCLTFSVDPLWLIFFGRSSLVVLRSTAVCVCQISIPRNISELFRQAVRNSKCMPPTLKSLKLPNSHAAVRVSEIRRDGETSSLPLATAGGDLPYPFWRHNAQHSPCSSRHFHVSFSGCLFCCTHSLTRSYSHALTQDGRPGHYFGPYGNAHAIICHVPAGTGSHAAGCQ